MIAYFATWDERIGPIIVDRYPSIINSPDLDIENITLQIYTILQAVFGKVKFDPISFTLPLKFAKRLVKIKFNAIPDPKIRGGYGPIFTVFLLPLEFPQDQTGRFDPLQDKIIQFYSQRTDYQNGKFLSRNEFDC